MKLSSDRIITTHVGSLPRPRSLARLLHSKESGETYDKAECTRQVSKSVHDVVRKQREIGVDVVDDGEHSKSSFSTYIRIRLGGLESIGQETQGTVLGKSKDALAFPGVYEENRVMYAARRALHNHPTIFDMTALTVSAPVRYIGHDEVRADIENLKAALKESPADEAFITALSPTNLALRFINKYYKTEEEYVTALAEAIREEYKIIVDAGFLLQVDDPRLASNYNSDANVTAAENRKFMEKRVEILNYALKGIPEEKVRFHTCYSVNVAPRIYDLELKDFVDLMLKIHAGGYSIEGANPRHEHEWQVWEETKLPKGKVLIPGVVSHCVHMVEHPELVAQRLERFAKVVGRERVIASNDCGFATAGAGDELHPDVAWAKLKSLVDGAHLASKRLWGRA